MLTYVLRQDYPSHPFESTVRADHAEIDEKTQRATFYNEKHEAIAVYFNVMYLDSTSPDAKV